MTVKSIPRDPAYGRPTQWSRLYERHFPDHTDGSSRHVVLISEALRQTASPLRKLLHDAGYEPDHMASSMEATVKMLWELREKMEGEQK